MKQIIVTASDRYKFDKEVGEKLEAGYKVVPGTIAIAIASSPKGESQYTAEVAERYAVILERQ